MTARSTSRRLYLIGFGIVGCAAAMWVLLAALAPAAGWMNQLSGSEQLARGSAVWLLLFLAAVISSTVGFAFSAIAGAMILHFVPNGVTDLHFHRMVHAALIVAGIALLIE
ncbi:MAG: hypothetical protein GEV05_13785 [Betaproteobacteria bacterium]|nr:hypothetical protein [Betaproteobacteria bacterium]